MTLEWRHVGSTILWVLARTSVFGIHFFLIWALWFSGKVSFEVFEAAKSFYTPSAFLAMAFSLGFFSLGDSWGAIVNSWKAGERKLKHLTNFAVNGIFGLLPTVLALLFLRWDIDSQISAMSSDLPESGRVSLEPSLMLLAGSIAASSWIHYRYLASIPRNQRTIWN